MINTLKYATLLIFLNCNAYSQDNIVVALQSLEFLNQIFYMNFEKEQDIILIKIDNLEEFICFKYITKTNLNDVQKIKLKYELKTLTNEIFEFKLINSSEFNGTFEILKEGNEYKFINLKYVKKVD